MKNIIFKFLFIIILGHSSLHAIKNEPLFSSGQQQAEPKIYINNRILTRVNGKPISTFDLMKKMDLLFYRQYPQYTSSIDARSQFYDMSWKYVLEEIIDKELILADAQESKIEVSNGDVRQEMEASFGPNIIANLDKAGISFDEATKIMQDEIITRRMISGRVHSKALRQVTPIKVRQAYAEFIQDPANARLTQWNYRTITIKERTLEKTGETAKAAYQMIMDGVPLDQLSNQLKAGKLLEGRAASLFPIPLNKTTRSFPENTVKSWLLSILECSASHLRIKAAPIIQRYSASCFSRRNLPEAFPPSKRWSPS